ncbi:MAG: winged helix-turn-helix transcriptional regulator [Clostridia bacterium]|nr:winged helix-turn-helix transcriptional regulator [Clostridia bacterium]
MELSEISLICKALSDPNRLQVIHILTRGERCACELLEQMQITQPTLSHHMKTLEDCSLVVSRKKGKWIHYSLNAGQWAAFCGHIESIRNACRTCAEGGCSC